MKLKNLQLSRRSTFIIIFICLIASISLISFFKDTKVKIDLISKYKDVSPAQTISSEEKLITKVYFNNVLGEEAALDPVVDVINNAKHSIEIAMFSFDSSKVKNALYKAASKGIQITLILDSTRGAKHNKMFSDLPQSITRIDVGSFDADTSTNNIYMHHKLLIADRGFETQMMITGSMDYTAKGEKYEQSFLLVTADKALTKVYGEEFDLLKRKIQGKSKFLEDKYYPWASHIEYSDSYVDVWFSPGFNTNSVKDKIIQEINASKKSIDIIMWQFTDKSIANALIKKAKEGIKVRIIADDLVANNSDSALPYIKKMIPEDKLSNIEIVVDTKSNSQIDLASLGDGFSAFIHHHFMIVDNSTIILGTNNWSSWGFYKNDEDTLVTNNTYLVTEFQKTFDFFYKTLK